MMATFRQSQRGYQIRALLPALLMLALALSTLWLNQLFSAQPEQQVMIREVKRFTPPSPPPPPPPPVNAQQAAQIQTAMQIQGDGPAVPMLEIDQTVDITQPSQPQIAFEQTQWQPLEIDWDAYDLSSLDALPSLLSAVKMDYPPSLESRGIEKVSVLLDVVIDEKGYISLIEITNNPHPELIREIHRFVRGSRFSPPMKDGVAVRARVNLPLEIKPD